MSTKKKTLITSRDDKGRHAVNLFAIEYDKAKLSADQAQRLNERGGELQKGIAQLIAELSVSNRFANEEVVSSFGYLSGYRKPNSIEAQIDILRLYWPQLNPDKAIHYWKEIASKLQLPDWIEGFFVWIRPGFFSSKHHEELEEILKAIEKDRKGKFHNYRAGQFNVDNFRQHAKTTLALDQIVEQQPDSDLLIVPAQFGIRYGGHSVRRAREVMNASEFGINSKDTGTMILTNLNRLQHYNDLWIDCAGDEFAPLADGGFSSAPFFKFCGGQVKFGTDHVGSASGSSGSASGFLSQ